MRVIDYIKKNEGFRRHMYLDTEGIPTIGYGFNLEQGFTEDECELILIRRAMALRGKLPQIVHGWSQLNLVRQDVLTDMAYNLGIAGLKKFKKMLAAINDRDYELAAHEMLDSRYAVQVGNRAHRNAQMMRTGEWYERN